MCEKEWVSTTSFAFDIYLKVVFYLIHNYCWGVYNYNVRINGHLKAKDWRQLTAKF